MKHSAAGSKIDGGESFLVDGAADVSAEFTEISELPNRGFNVLLRAQRYGRWWLLKGLKEEFRGDKFYKLQLQKEFELLSGLQDPHVVSAFSLEEVPAWGPCIVMEWVDGTTLSEWLAEEKRPRQKRLDVALQLADALCYVHDCQVVHRDLKPSNIMVTRSGGYVKLIDFGLSDADNYAVLKQPAGTLGYTSDEQLSGKQTDVRNDIYSYGCVLDDLRLGWPYGGIVRRCTAPLSKRYASMEAVRRSFRRRRWWPWLIALAVVALCAAGMWWQWNRERLDLRTQTERTAVVTDSLTGEVRTLREESAVADERSRMLQQKNDSLQLRLDELSKERRSAELQAQLVEELKAKGKREMDGLVAASGIERHLDTLQSALFFDAKYNATIERLGEFPDAFVHGLPDAVSESDRSAITYSLESYLSSRYMTRWRQRLGF